MKKRLLVFGCSHTYGYGLDDCWPDITQPSKLGWANIIATQMDRTLINDSYPGASNKYIWHRIKHTKFEPDDIVIILWSYMRRNTVLLNEDKCIHLSHVNLEADPVSNAYFKYIHSDYECIQMTELFINDASIFLKNQKIQFYQMIANRGSLSLFGTNTFLDIVIDDYRTQYPKAIDNQHMGIDGNIKFAADILTRMGYNHTLPKVKKLCLLTRIKNWFLIRMNVRF